MSTLSREVPDPQEVTPKKGSAKMERDKLGAGSRPPRPPPKPLRSVESKAERVAAAKTPVKIDEPKVGEVHQAGARAHTAEPTRRGQH